eukprot:TRINITY_DN65314_c0_g1_i1.p1 TRINITY_DN65314_c0_g1~~TRINITY_DN65314_c0_g1_i1.p1  ORF type:complete len:450 (+),score=68.71 TRINITY_DN65314_c0_g1_i1:28-1350(+)
MLRLRLITCVAGSFLTALLLHGCQSKAARGVELRGVLVDKKLHSKARCLDGSSPCFYLRKPAESSRKFLIFFQGGGFCTSETDCQERSKGTLGSTQDECPDSDAAGFFHGRVITSNISSINPLMHDWNQVFVRYCDGGYFAGDREDVSEEGLYYRGRYITEAVFATLAEEHELSSATDVVISGCSAGAIRTISHIDAMADMVRNVVTDQVRIAAIADSGYYLDDTGKYGNWSDYSLEPHADGTDGFTKTKEFATSVRGQNGTALLNEECLKHTNARSLGPNYCLIGSVSAQFAQTPLFLWQSRFDSDQLLCDRPAQCTRRVAGEWKLGNSTLENEWGNRLVQYLETSFLQNVSKPRGAFLDSCSRHCEGAYLPQDCRTGKTPLEAFEEWYKGDFSQVYYHQTEDQFSAQNAYDTCSPYVCCKPADGTCSAAEQLVSTWVV